MWKNSWNEIERRRNNHLEQKKPSIDDRIATIRINLFNDGGLLPKV
jgi:hypothetical protein